MKNQLRVAGESERERTLKTLLQIFGDQKPLSEEDREREHFQHYEERDAQIRSVRQEATRLGMKILDASDLRDYTAFKENLSPTYFIPNELYLMLEGSDKAPTIFEVVKADNNAFLVIERRDRDLAVRLEQRYQAHLASMPQSDEDRLQELAESNPGLSEYLQFGK